MIRAACRLGEGDLQHKNTHHEPLDIGKSMDMNMKATTDGDSSTSTSVVLESPFRQDGKCLRDASHHTHPSSALEATSNLPSSMPDSLDPAVRTPASAHPSRPCHEVQYLTDRCPSQYIDFLSFLSSLPQSLKHERLVVEISNYLSMQHDKDTADGISIQFIHDNDKFSAARTVAINSLTFPLPKRRLPPPSEKSKALQRAENGASGANATLEENEALAKPLDDDDDDDKSTTLLARYPFKRPFPSLSPTTAANLKRSRLDCLPKPDAAAQTPQPSRPSARTVLLSGSRLSRNPGATVALPTDGSSLRIYSRQEGLGKNPESSLSAATAKPVAIVGEKHDSPSSSGDERGSTVLPSIETILEEKSALGAWDNPVDLT